MVIHRSDISTPHISTPVRNSDRIGAGFAPHGLLSKPVLSYLNLERELCSLGSVMLLFVNIFDSVPISRDGTNCHLRHLHSLLPKGVRGLWDIVILAKVRPLFM